jgi:hypothetical protein
MSEPQEWMIALQGGSETISIDNIYNNKKRWLLYTTLLELEGLPSTIRGAILKEMGSSLRDELDWSAYQHAMMCREAIKAVKARMRKMRKNGDRPPRGGIHDAAVAEIAAQLRIKPEALKGRLRRHAPSQKRTGRSTTTPLK